MSAEQLHILFMLMLRMPNVLGPGVLIMMTIGRLGVNYNLNRLKGVIQNQFTFEIYKTPLNPKAERTNLKII